MKGTVLTVDLRAGNAVVSGDDGVRYRFRVADWREQQPPVKGQRVDFVAADGQRASDIYLDPEAQSSPHGAAAARPATPGGPVGLDERYRGIYCSTDDKVLLGLCGGLAHRFGLDATYVRAGVFLVGFFVAWLPYLLGFFLPRLPTRGLPRPN